MTDISCQNQNSVEQTATSWGETRLASIRKGLVRRMYNFDHRKLVESRYKYGQVFARLDFL